METNLGENERQQSQTDSGVGRSAPYSPRVSRPKLPTFSGISYRRSRTAPIPSSSGEGEFKDLIRDIAKLKKVDFIKTYSRSRTPASRPADLKTMSTTTSPIGSPTLISPTSEIGKPGPSGGRRLNRSLSLKLLTERLKSGRCSSEASQSRNNIPDSGSRDYGHTSAFGTLRRVFPQRARNMSETVGDSQLSTQEPKPGTSDSKLTSDEPGKTMDSKSSDIDDRKEKPDEVVSSKNGQRTGDPCKSETDLSKHSEASSLEADTSRTFVSSCVLGVPKSQTDIEPLSDTPEGDAQKHLPKGLDVSEDEGVDSGDHSLRKSMESRSRSPSTGRPHRRSGAAAVAMSSEVQKVFGGQTDYDPGDEGAKDEDQGPRRFARRSDSGVNGNGQKTSSLRFVTHPPQRKSNLSEGGSVDSNGLGSLKSHNGEDAPAGPGELAPQESDMSLADSHISFGESDVEPSYSEVVESVVGEGSDPDKFEKRNGKSLKQKSKSDPSGDKTREALELPMGELPSHAPSTPALTEGTEETGLLPEFKVTEEDKKAKSQSENVLSKLVDISSQPDEGTIFKTPPETPELGRKDTSIASGYGDTPVPREHHTRYSGFAQSLSPSWTDSERPVRRYAGPSASSSTKPASPTPHERSHPYTLLLSVPPPRKPILRSSSSASVLQRDQRRGYFSSLAPSSKEKEPVRKYSATTDEAPSAQALKAGTSVPEFAAAIGDSMAALATSMPDVWQPSSAPASPEREIEVSIERMKDKRYHIVEELYRNEKEYVDALKTLKDKYMSPLKSQSVLDDTVVDNIFYMVPEILIHHSIYLDFLDNVWKNWDSQYSTVGNILINIFSKQTVLDSYLSFVENYKSSGRVIESALLTKSSVSKFLEQCHRDSGSKLTIKDLIVRPIQRIPRYELLLQRLIENTPKDHPDFRLLQQAEKVMHDLALKIGTVTDTKQEEDMQETLKKLELLLVTELNAPDRTYLRHDMVQISNKKDQCCMWLFSDLIIFSSVKRKSGPVARKVSLILKSPSGQDYAENIKHKTWLRVGLDDIEILKLGGSLSRRPTFDKEQVEEDLNILNQVNELCLQLQCNHQILEDAVKELASSLGRQLTDYARSPSAESNKLELLVTTQEGVLHSLVIFSSAEKRSSWESAFWDAKQKLSLLSDKRAPEFLQPLQITKTRAGMQFSCAAPIDGLNANGYRDVWVCNSDGYVGHMCLLSLQPEPIVTLNTPVPGCNARILCICAVPSFSGPFRRKGSNKSYRQRASPGRSSPHVTIESPDSMDNGNDEDGYQSDSESSDDEPIAFRASQGEESFFPKEYEGLTVPGSPTSPTAQPITTSGCWTQDPHKSTMWLGTEDGCIHIFQCTDNIKTTKNKLKIQHGASVYCIVYLDNKVFLSLANGNLIVYKRDQDGQWVCDQPLVRSLGSANAPITKMLAVAGKLWCGCQNNISVISPVTLNIERSFTVSSDSNRSVQCLVTSGQGVWIASQQSAKVLLYHATSYEYLLEVSIAQAVSQKLQSADDIIRQHKAACLRITALLICKDLLWVGTSAGVILTIPIPKITSTTTRGSLTVPIVTGLVYGHTGHVRFLTSIELPSSILQKLEISSDDQANENLSLSDIQRRASMATPATMATRMLVISGGDGYEDFRNNVSNEAAGRDDSTNHLLLWQV